MTGVEIALTLHLLGVIFWVGGMGARLLLLGSIRSGTDESTRKELHLVQRNVHLRMEVPAFLLALLAGLYLVHATGVTFHQTWFSVKMVLLLGVITVDLLASRQFRAVRPVGREARAGRLGAVLVVLTFLMLFAGLTRF